MPCRTSVLSCFLSKLLLVNPPAGNWPTGRGACFRTLLMMKQGGEVELRSFCVSTFRHWISHILCIWFIFFDWILMLQCRTVDQCILLVRKKHLNCKIRGILLWHNFKKHLKNTGTYKTSEKNTFPTLSSYKVWLNTKICRTSYLESACVSLLSILAPWNHVFKPSGTGKTHADHNHFSMWQHSDIFDERL